MTDMEIKVFLEEADVKKDFIPDHTENELKCPFCGQEIKIAGEHTTIMSCFNGDCKGSGLYGEKAFWQQLIHTRKALDVAVDALKSVRKNLCEMPDPSGATIFRMACESATTVKKALDQTTALEQKDIK